MSIDVSFTMTQSPTSSPQVRNHRRFLVSEQENHSMGPEEAASVAKGQRMNGFDPKIYSMKSGARLVRLMEDCHAYRVTTFMEVQRSDGLILRSEEPPCLGIIRDKGPNKNPRRELITLPALCGDGENDATFMREHVPFSIPVTDAVKQKLESLDVGVGVVISCGFGLTKGPDEMTVVEINVKDTDGRSEPDAIALMLLTDPNAAEFFGEADKEE
ncbi:hypothetical protein K469DRAFT_686694 [Zopfia rhizophila CBS 207.26]|uniref:Uncharacterized protein n=1 Tax=Zopfia rhizophila CBS 207.26 TaxID=1314779 RepID=A0A6A6EVC0_9PEZI|nr:hypothetical protein K469DRAFT_686694 [Zopfia rhizophila CBS 207.26]